MGNGLAAGRVGDGMTTLGIIGAGNIGSNVAKAALAHGYDVVISNSRGPTRSVTSWPSSEPEPVLPPPRMRHATATWWWWPFR